jgi:hypothetical protein
LSIEIREFQCDKRKGRQLWRFDCDLYRSDRSWIPPLRKTYLQHFSAGSVLYDDHRDHRRHFVAELNGQVLGHVSAFVNHDLREHDQGIGTLGMFECVEAEEVASQLFGRAVAWLRKEHEIRRIWAPMTFDIWHGYRLMTRGFGSEPFVGEPRNPAHYPAFFERSGFTIRKRWHSVELNDRQSLERLNRPSRERYREILEKGYQFRPINRRDSEQMSALCQMVVASFQRFLGYTTPPTSVIAELATAAYQMTDPALSCLAYDPHGVPCGFGIAYPDQSAAVRAMCGRSGIWGRLKFLVNHRRHGNRVIFYLLGITPEELEKRHGLGRALFHATIDKSLQSHFGSVLLAIIADDSPARSLLGSFMELADREYALYEME